MTNFIIDDYTLNQECEQLARCAFEEFRTYADTDADEVLWHMVDAHEWVIYTYKAALLCAECDIDQGEEFLQEIGTTEFRDFAHHVSLLAFATILTKSREFLADLIEESEEA